jgi:VWFA-related protein
MFLVVVLYVACAALGAQEMPQGPGGAPPVIRTETREVLVDVVVTDKKGQYLGDLEMKNFKVWEDNKEQQVKSFSFGADASQPDGGKKRYLVLFFDASTMGPAEQMQSRAAAAKFIASNAGPDRLIAVVNFTGAIQVAQNFTDDISRLQAAVSGIKTSLVSPNMQTASLGVPQLGRAERDFGARSLLLGLMSMAKNLGEIKGRKSLVLFTSGFPLANQTRSEVTAAIDQCNKSNVAVYPIDARGLAPVGPSITDPMGRGRGRASLDLPTAAGHGGIALAAFPVVRIANFFLEQQGGVGSGRTGVGGGAPGGNTGGNTGGAGGVNRGGGITGSPGGNTGGNPGGRTGTGNPNTGGVTRGGNNNGTVNNNPNGVPNGNNNGRNNNNNGGFYDPNNPNNPNNRNPFGNASRTINPELDRGIGDRQELMYLLANGTGGFVIVNTNDLLGGMEKIGREQNQYYVLAYTPPESPEGSCHALRVKVDRGGTNVRARTGYCNVKSHDALAGSPVEKTLESRVTGSSPGNVAAAMRAPFFYTSPDTARVAVAMEIPIDKMKFEKVKGKQHAAMNVLGIAYKSDGSVAARFSDAVKFDFESGKEAEKFKEKPLHYENQFEVMAGSYTLKVAFDSGNDNFGRLETPLLINQFDGKQFAVSGLALSTRFARTTQAETGIDAILLEGRAPLVAGDLQITPSGASRFSRNDTVVMYFEVYEPLLTEEKPPQVGAQLRIVDAKTGEEKSDSGAVAITNYVRAGSPVVAAGLKLPVNTLSSGNYKVEIKALDSAGNFAVRSADFVIE